MLSYNFTILRLNTPCFSYFHEFVTIIYLFYSYMISVAEAFLLVVTSMGSAATLMVHATISVSESHLLFQSINKYKHITVGRNICQKSNTTDFVSVFLNITGQNKRCTKSCHICITLCKWKWNIRLGLKANFKKQKKHVLLEITEEKNTKRFFVGPLLADNFILWGARWP